MAEKRYHHERSRARREGRLEEWLRDRAEAQRKLREARLEADREKQLLEEKRKREKQAERRSVSSHRSAILASARKRAKESGVLYALKMDTVDWLDRCPVLGTELIYGGDRSKVGLENKPSLDRFNPEYGYVKTNVTVISVRANIVKNDGTAEEHELVAKWMRSRKQACLGRRRSSE